MLLAMQALLLPVILQEEEEEEEQQQQQQQHSSSSTNTRQNQEAAPVCVSVPEARRFPSPPLHSSPLSLPDGLDYFLFSPVAPMKPSPSPYPCSPPCHPSHPACLSIPIEG
ncbi:hypothetical protein BO70DRAFT_358852 [Aspergillus heteromorphus CBS 117.55]|uniref:Uncharacterized protein n=1 Tax=Aspergillus heteromorphus CBS 117.55 TaxID=1448321 RepID=A0A317WTZ2_9EURO|nr:uncharacterized protein BO70DRAFT_358852 [Aspergillus heteromorphus CBS 117.55]PWY89816.1 hypothetical protein BO70DRAFT_358852 [Aspergillus heteromorphus CBS 117.55]